MVVASKGLGRGLGALFQDDLPQRDGSNNPTESLANAKLISVNNIIPNPNQPRKDFDTDALNDLTDSIREQGLLQPILVRPITSVDSEQIIQKYEIVAGERRWRASQLAGLTELPVVVKELTEAQALALALIENLQREDLNPMEEALGIQRLKDDFGLSQDDLAKQLGKSRSAVANSLRLVNLSGNAQQALREGLISPGHARALLSFEKDEEREKILKRIQDEDLTVRTVEALAYVAKEKPVTPDTEQVASSMNALDESSDTAQITQPELIDKQYGNQIDNPLDNPNDKHKDGLQGSINDELDIEAKPVKKPQSVTILSIQNKLAEAVNLPVKINGLADKGRISISYSTKTELMHILAKLGIQENLE